MPYYQDILFLLIFTCNNTLIIAVSWPVHLSIQLYVSKAVLITHTDIYNSQLLQKLEGTMEHKTADTTKGEYCCLSLQVL